MKGVRANRRMGGNKTKSVHKQVLAIINANRERKVFTADLATNAALVTTGTGYRVSGGIVDGVTSQERDGSQISLDSIEVFFRVTAATTSTNARLIIVQDTQANAADMSLQVLLNSAAYYSQYHPVIQEQQKRFKILLDKRFDPSVTGDQIKSLSVILKPARIVTYNDSTDVSTACGKNFVWAWVIGDQTTSTYALTITQRFYDS